jgi:hydroxylamine reductase
MDKKMFCFQCEQTAGCTGCMGNAGVCGKDSTTAALQDELTGALIGLAKSCGSNPKTDNTDRIIIEGLFTTITNVNFNNETLKNMIDRVHKEKNIISPDCSVCQSRCGNTDDYDINNIWDADEDIYRQVSVIMYVQRQYDSYNTYMEMNRRTEALNALIKGMERYDTYIDEAKFLGVGDDVEAIKKQIVTALQKSFSISESEAETLVDLSNKDFTQYYLKIEAYGEA